MNPPSSHAPTPPRLFDDFPLPFAELKTIYQRFTARFEYHRSSFADFFSQALQEQRLQDLEKEWATATIAPAPPRQWPEELVQRHFYWSATSFYRSYYLFLSYLALDRKAMTSWAHVTAYYSRFYFIQALSNLWLSHIVQLDRSAIHDKKDHLFLTRIGTDGVRLERLANIKGIPQRGSHQPWWRLFYEFRHVDDAPELDTFSLSEAYFNPKTRNPVNYSERYLEGFIELEWFDTPLREMRSQLSMMKPRPDRDITDLDRFFEGCASSNVDEADFYGDEAQILWTSITTYLKILEALTFVQPFVSVPKIQAMNDLYLSTEYPKLAKGIDQFLRKLTLITPD